MLSASQRPTTELSFLTLCARCAAAFGIAVNWLEYRVLHEFDETLGAPAPARVCLERAACFGVRSLGVVQPSDCFMNRKVCS